MLSTIPSRPAHSRPRAGRRSPAPAFRRAQWSRAPAPSLSAAIRSRPVASSGPSSDGAPTRPLTVKSPAAVPLTFAALPITPARASAATSRPTSPAPAWIEPPIDDAARLVASTVPLRSPLSRAPVVPTSSVASCQCWPCNANMTVPSTGRDAAVPATPVTARAPAVSCNCSSRGAVHRASSMPLSRAAGMTCPAPFSALRTTDARSTFCHSTRTAPGPSNEVCPRAEIVPPARRAPRLVTVAVDPVMRRTASTSAGGTPATRTRRPVSATTASGRASAPASRTSACDVPLIARPESSHGASAARSASATMCRSTRGALVSASIRPSTVSVPSGRRSASAPMPRSPPFHESRPSSVCTVVRWSIHVI